MKLHFQGGLSSLNALNSVSTEKKQSISAVNTPIVDTVKFSSNQDRKQQLATELADLAFKRAEELRSQNTELDEVLNDLDEMFEGRENVKNLFVKMMLEDTNVEELEQDLQDEKANPSSAEEILIGLTFLGLGGMLDDMFGDEDF